MGRTIYLRLAGSKTYDLLRVDVKDSLYKNPAATFRTLLDKHTTGVLPTDPTTDVVALYGDDMQRVFLEEPLGGLMDKLFALSDDAPRIAIVISPREVAPATSTSHTSSRVLAIGGHAGAGAGVSDSDTSTDDDEWSEDAEEAESDDAEDDGPATESLIGLGPLPEEIRSTMPTIADAEAMMKAFNVNPAVVPANRLFAGMLVETEHGSLLGDTRFDVTLDDLSEAARIALAHFQENPGLRVKNRTVIKDYYEMLAKAERAAARKWRGKRKPNVLIPF